MHRMLDGPAAPRTGRVKQRVFLHTERLAPYYPSETSSHHPFDAIAARLEMKSSEAALSYFTRAADHLELSESMRRRLIVAKREIQVQVTIELDNDEVATFVGYRVQHDNSRGPMKGGFRYHPQVDLDEIRSL